MVTSLVLGLALVQGATQTASLAPVPSPMGFAVAVRAVPDAPTVDGVLDDVAWLNAPVLDGFVQREPDEGAPPTEPTEARIVFSDGALYIAFQLVCGSFFISSIETPGVAMK